MSGLPAKPDELRWAAMPFMEQMANIGSEVGRTAKWVQKGKPEQAESAYVRALDLFVKAFPDSDIDTLNWLDSYFLHFATAVRRVMTNL